MSKKLNFTCVFVLMLLLSSFLGSADEPKSTPHLSGVLGYEGSDNTFYGYRAGAAITTGTGDTFIGLASGYRNTTGSNNSFLGGHSGYNNISGNYNTFIGRQAGYSNDTGYYNTFLGCYAGYSNTFGDNNTYIGGYAGRYTTYGNRNTIIGMEAGYNNTTGMDNVYLGYSAGNQNLYGSGNVCLGARAGYYETGSNKLYIANSDTSSPLIYGQFDNAVVTINGKLGIGVNPSYPLHMASGAYCSTGGTWTNASSRALKENIKELDANEALSAFEKLIPVKYNYKVDKNDKHVGFIAEDAPELVATADKKGMSPMDVVAVLTKVLQEQQRVNQEQQKIIADLQERLAKIEKK
ncbi:MAG: hypothetical protein QG657_2479 [Acidobacteriota bacterium]|nr:hypothetical protein [Acidobacteriota bacterium]